MLRQDYIDIAIIICFGLFLFLLPGIIHDYKEPAKSDYRGCVASAYQAEKNGFNLEENLKACEQYEN